MRVATLAAQGLVEPDAGPPTADPCAEVVVGVDAGGRIGFVNTAFVRLCDVMPGQLRGMQFAEFVDPFDRAKAVATYQAPLRPRRDWELNLHTRRRRAFFSFDCWPVSSADGPLLVLVGRDLTEQTAGGPGR
jgi:hypothetical protein